MKLCIASLESIAPYSQSKAIMGGKRDDESHDDFERRAWPERIHADKDGNVFIPPMAFKKAIDAAAVYMKMKIPGQGQATYSKKFASGILVMDPLVLPITKEQVPGEWLHLDANGKKMGQGSSGRVHRCMPRIDSWAGDLHIHVIDEIVLNTFKGKRTVLEEVLNTAGALIGIGRFRPAVGGFYGRFVVKSFEIREMGDVQAA